MLSKNEIKTIASLKRKSQRLATQSFVVEGYKMLEELLKSDYHIIKIIAQHSADDGLKCDIPTSVDYEEVNANTMSRISQMKHTAPVLAWVEIPKKKPILNTALKSLMVDAIQDPGNLGTIIRTAHWFGFQQIVLSPDSVDLYNHKVIQASMGAVFKMSVVYMDLAQAIQDFKDKGSRVLGTYLEGQSIYDFTFEAQDVFVLGNEGHGISASLEPLMSDKIHIPNFALGLPSESLNIASAGAVICSEMARCSIS